VDSSGKFTKDWETDQFKSAVQLVHDVYADGSFDPNPNLNTVSMSQAWMAGRLGFCFFTATATNMFDAGVTPNHPFTPTQNPPWVNRLAPPIPAETGGKGQYNLDNGIVALLALKKAPPERIKLLLRVLDYIVSPFGSQEYLTVNYGQVGQDYNLDAKGNPVRTKQGMQDQITWAASMGSPAAVLFDPDDAQFAPTQSESLKALGTVAREDPTIGLYSASDAKNGLVLQGKVGDALADIVAGRRPMSDYDAIIADWRTSGGNTIKDEYARAYAAAH
jgi:putative aldouronate transport system substrate-binding protein